MFARRPWDIYNWTIVARWGCRFDARWFKFYQSEGSISKVLVCDVQIRSAVQELSNGRPLLGTIHVSDVTFKPGGIVLPHVAKGLVTRVSLRESLCFFLNLGAMVIEMPACFCPGFPNYWLRISRWITCNWSHPSSILLVTHVMQDAWWSAERKGKRKREELRSHSRANRSGRISHDFTTYEDILYFQNIWCSVDIDEFVHRCHR